MARVVRPQAQPVKPSPKPQPTLPNNPNFNRNKRSIFLIMLAIPLVTVSSFVLYKRVVLGQPKRIQQGEYTPDGGLRLFDAEEKKERDSTSWVTRIFGKEQ